MCHYYFQYCKTCGERLANKAPIFAMQCATSRAAATSAFPILPVQFMSHAALMGGGETVGNIHAYVESDDPDYAEFGTDIMHIANSDSDLSLNPPDPEDCEACHSINLRREMLAKRINDDPKKKRRGKGPARPKPPPSSLRNSMSAKTPSPEPEAMPKK